MSQTPKIFTPAQQITEIQRYLELCAGAIIGSIGFQAFTVPLGLYNGGVVGVAQIIRTLLISGLGLSPAIDYAGILNLVLNVPLMLLAVRYIGKAFFVRTLFCMVVQTLVVSAIHLPAPLVEDPLTACLIGGLLSGAGIGIILRAGGSTAGFDILGVWLSKNKVPLGVGVITNAMNACIYIACALLFNVETAIYSLIFAAVCAIVTDKVHTQSVNCSVMIITSSSRMPELIMESVQRGTTVWEGLGAHTGTPRYICFTVVNKFEETTLRKTVETEDPNAFITVSENLRVYGNFIRRLS